jgi:hypothetical protein
MPLDEQRRSQLDSIVQKMEAEGDHANIQFVVDDFKSKYDAPATTPQPMSGFRHTASDPGAMVEVAKGFGKKALDSVADLGELVHKIPGISTAVDALYGQKGLSQRAFPEAEKTLAPSNPNQELGGMMETAAEMMLPASKATSAPGVVSRGLGISKVRAADNFTDVAAAAKNAVVDVEKTGNACIRVLELAERGGSRPKVVKDFMARVTDPNKPPMTFDEARDFYSNISGLSAKEKTRLTPIIRRQMVEMREALNSALTEAAETVGKGDQYSSAVQEYARSIWAKKKATQVAKGAAAAAGVGAVGGLGFKVFSQ